MRPRPPWLVAVGVVVAALTLSACGTTTTQGASPVTGFPSSSISVPLRVVACTTSNSCLAVGASGSDAPPGAVGEYRQVNGSWIGLRVPSVSTPLLGSASCWTDGCLVGGSQATGDLIWVYRSSPASLTTTLTTPSGHGVSAVSCFTVDSCGVLDSTGVAGHSQLLFTINAGATWTTPSALLWTKGASVTTLSCTDELSCIVGATTSDGRALVKVTSDGGITWTKSVTPSDWIALTSLTCRAQHCVGLATTGSGTNLVTTRSFAQSWTSLRLRAHASALACTTLSRCVVAGETRAQQPWLATVRHAEVTAHSLQYVPTVLSGVACGTTYCAAIGVSTVLAFRP
jgi:hypothetical protein